MATVWLRVRGGQLYGFVLACCSALTAGAWSMPFGSEGLGHGSRPASSGGGFRATLSGIGAFRPLVELAQLARILSVSGRSIISGFRASLHRTGASAVPSSGHHNMIDSRIGFSKNPALPLARGVERFYALPFNRHGRKSGAIRLGRRCRPEREVGYTVCIDLSDGSVADNGRPRRFTSHNRLCVHRTNTGSARWRSKTS